MSKENIHTASSEQNLDKYGVWIKKNPTEPKKEFDFFSNVQVETEPLSEETIQDDFSQPVLRNTDNLNDDLEVLNFDDSVGFSHLETELVETETLEELSVENKQEIVDEQEQTMNFDSDEIEEIDLDDFLSEAGPLETSHEDTMAVNRETTDNSVDFDAVEDTTKDADTPETVDLDISFDSNETPVDTTQHTSSSSAFDDMLDELTSSSDEMVEVSLDDFIDDFEPPKKEEEEEFQERPEPKTTIEEFSLDSIKSGSSSNVSSSTKGSTKEESVSSSSNTSSQGFEDISLDDFFSDTNEAVDAITPGVSTQSSGAGVSSGISLSIDESSDLSGVQEISITGANEVEDISLFGTDVQEVPSSSQLSSADDTADVLTVSSENTYHDVGFTDDFETPSTTSDLGDLDIESELDIDGGGVYESSHLREADVADLTATVEENSDFVPSLPDFEVEVGDDEKQELVHAPLHIDESEQIVKNEQFDDVNALTADLLDTPSEHLETSEVVTGAISGGGMVENDKTTELLMKLVDEVASMKNEIACLKDELVSVKDSSKVVSTPPIVETAETSVGEQNSSDMSSIDTSQVEVPSIENFDLNDSQDISESLAILDEGASKQETGFFSDDGIDETIALTGDELNNILNTADFVEEQNPDEFDIPEVLNIDETFSVDDDLDAGSDSALEMEEVDMDAFTNDDTLQIHDDLPNEEMPDFVVEPITTLDVSTDFLDKTDEQEEDVSQEDTDTLIDIHDEFFPDELLAQEEEAIPAEPILTTDEKTNFDTDDLDTIVEDIPLADLDVTGLDERTASTAEQKISTVSDELSHSNTSATVLPIDMKEEIKSVLTYMDQLLESLPEEKIEEFAKSEYFETYKKLFDELGIS
ncbi:MAG: hypothetical protein IJU92_02215 [Spirochaetaceae bacterium]|nr:hypothetical protein [Spirochaetaceae bacterium]